MSYYAIHSPRGFSNEYDVIAFESKAARDRFCVDKPAWPVTRKRARFELAIQLDPGTIDARGGNCYLKTRSRHHDDSMAISECEYWIDYHTELNHGSSSMHDGDCSPGSPVAPAFSPVVDPAVPSKTSAFTRSSLGGGGTST